MTPQEQDAAVLDAMRRARKDLYVSSGATLAGSLGITKEQLGRSLSRLVASGHIRQSKRSLCWRVVEE